MQDVQVKLWDLSRTRAIPERLRGVIMIRRNTNQIHVYIYIYKIAKPLPHMVYRSGIHKQEGNVL